jgi:DNA-binding transcriptional LysR family regulator
MAKRIDWETQIGRRLRLRDLHAFFMVARCGNMAKAARQLGVSAPAVSKVIADLEYALGVRLLDRGRRGVEPTIYGQALLKRSTAVFDELRQSVRDIEFLADPTVGEVRIGVGEGIATAILPCVIQRFSQLHPRVTLRLVEPGVALNSPGLRERLLDFTVRRLSTFPVDERLADDLNVEVIFNDQLVVAAGRESRWARRRKIDLAELVDEPWILSGPDTWNYREIEEVFRGRGLAMPKTSLDTYYTSLRCTLLASGPYIATFPASALHFDADRYSLTILPVDLPIRPWPVAVVTLKNRTLSPVAERFIEHVRAFARSMYPNGQVLQRCRKTRW